MSDTADARVSRRDVHPLRAEFLLFAFLTVFFLIVGTAYLVVAEAEPVGTTAFYMVAGLAGIIAGYLWVLSRRISVRPEDDPLGEIAVRTGEIGVFSPHSWWPLVLGAASALLFLGVAIGFWITGIGVAIGLIGLVGLVFEFSRGQHAH
jgi:hypothetical protein